MKKYLWCLKDGDEMHGMFDSVDEATNDAREVLAEDDESQDVVIWDARPATPADDTDFEGVDPDEGGCDTSQPNWWVGRYIPENIAHEFTFDPATPPSAAD